MDARLRFNGNLTRLTKPEGLRCRFLVGVLFADDQISRFCLSNVDTLMVERQIVAFFSSVTQGVRRPSPCSGSRADSDQSGSGAWGWKPHFHSTRRVLKCCAQEYAAHPQQVLVAGIGKLVHRAIT